jgi:hypothetical protein
VSVVRKELGKIKSVRYGFGGYQDAQFGLSVSMGGESWGVSDFWGGWASEPDKLAKWTRAEQLECHGQTADRVCKLLQSAHVQGVDGLEGVPVEVTFDGQRLQSWRVLTEVL